MRVVIVGAGPAGLYAAILLRRARPDARIRVYEQGAADATWGFGVVFSDRALEFLRADDAETADLIEPYLQTWSGITVVHRGIRVGVDGVGFSAIGRLEMLALLRRRAAELGVVPEYRSRVEDPAVFDDADLVIGADGLNSTVRASAPGAFGESIARLNNRFVWYGVGRAFDTLTQTFKASEFGPFTAHHYRYAPDRSTFIVECGAPTFDRAGFERMAEPESRAVCETVFVDELDGAPLTANNSTWRRFPVLRCARWHYRNRVLIGDALHTAHFSIGSGTRLAMEDAAALARALTGADFDVAAALPAYQAARQPVLDKLLAAAGASAAWYERFGEHMALDPCRFALSYMLRSGRLDAAGLGALAPAFTRRLRERGIDPSRAGAGSRV